LSLHYLTTIKCLNAEYQCGPIDYFSIQTYTSFSLNSDPLRGRRIRRFGSKRNGLERWAP